MPIPHFDATVFPFDAAPIMQRCIALASQAIGRTEPNPPVGAVLVDAMGQTIAEGYHERAGAMHAEVAALSQLSSTAPADAILFVSLEPCNHQGRTGACTEYILQKGIGRVVYGVDDSAVHPGGGGGGEYLQNAGVQVWHGLERKDCQRLCRPFFVHHSRQRPYVIAKVGASLDGKIALASGESQWITPPAARGLGHELRHRCSAICVGVGTILADNPRLTDRSGHSPPQHPVRVVFDSSGRTPLDSYFCSERKGAQRYLIASQSLSAAREQQYEALGVRVYRGSSGGRVAVAEGLKYLYTSGICSILLEGGGSLIASFLQDDCIDELRVYQSGAILGADSLSWVGALGLGSLKQAPAFRIHRVKMSDDLEAEDSFVEIIAENPRSIAD